MSIKSLLTERSDLDDVTVAVGVDDSFNPRELKQLNLDGMDVAEIRIDLFKDLSLENIKNTISQYSDKNTIATIRLKTEGGGWNKSEVERLKIFEEIIPQVDAIDVENVAPDTIQNLIPLLQKHNTDLIVSHHDFEKTPTALELNDIKTSAENIGADIIKIATLCNSVSDRQRLAQTLVVDNGEQNLIVIGMGAGSVITRTSFPALGSLLTFASFGRFSTAPGQLPLRSMMENLRHLYPNYNERKIIELEILECA